ncbi:lipopolysaccharide biosynthesis protein [Pseudonocardia phyllosphaerae]|uniref:lipopolysaccharide biosynthesis protein n=1 Tax=Pseudonocardia phyllosphaerae TaxID=3390502 RepID=UPI003978602B
MTVQEQTRDAGRLARVGLAAAMVSRVLGRLVGVLLVVLLAREAAPETVAVYGYLLGTATLVATLTDLGVAGIAGREVAAGRLPAGPALYAALLPQAVSIAGAVAVTVTLTLLAGPAGVPPAALLLTSLFVVVAGFVNLWSELLRASGRVVAEAVLQVGSAVLLVGSGIAVVVSGGDAVALLAVVLAKETALLVVLVALVRPRRDLGVVRSRALLGQSLWLAAGGIGIILLWRQGTVVVGATAPVAALAAYVVASRFLDAGVTVAHTAGFGLVPGMSGLAAGDDRAAFRREARRLVLGAAGVGVVVGVAGVALAGPLTTGLFGDRWAGAVDAVRMIAVIALPMLVAYVCWTLLLALGRVRRIAAVAGAASATGVVTSLLWTLADPSPFGAVAGTAAGAVVLAAGFLTGVRDQLV